MVHDAPADVPLQTYAAAAPISDGLRMATGGAFDTDFHASDPGRTGPGAFLLGSDAINASFQATIVANRSETVSPWIVNAFSISEGTADVANVAWSGNDAVQSFQGSRSASRLLQPVVNDRSFSAEFAFGATRSETGLAFDLNVVPSLSYEQEGEFAVRSVGAEIRLGRDFDQRGTSAIADSWYIFAGTEGEALVWEAGEYGFSTITGAMALRDQVTVGDIQAGVSVQRGLGQLSLSYIRREVSWSDRNGGASLDEDFAGVSFTLKR